MKENDLAGASLTLGKEIFLARTKIHYASFDRENLQVLHEKAWAEIVRIAGTYSAETSTFSPSARPEYIGTPFRPTLSTVQQLIGQLKGKISSKPEKGSLSETVDHHNAYALYSILMVSFSTGYRAVNSPYISEEMLDEQTGFCFIRDKDSADFYHSKLVPCNVHNFG